MSLFTLAFLRYAGERAIKTVAQSAVALLTAGQSGLLTVAWPTVASVAGLAGVVSMLTSVIAYTEAARATADATAPGYVPEHGQPAEAADGTHILPTV